MGYTLDYFVGALRCPVCGNTSPADSSTNMQTYIRDDPQLANLGVGDRVEVDPETMPDKGYLTIRDPAPGEAIRILQTWECPFCGAPANWAEIVIKDNIIQSVEAVDLTRTVFEQANYISTEVIGVAGALTGLSPRDLIEKDLVQLLRDHLA